MLAVPYGLLGVFGFMIWRGMKKNERFRLTDRDSAADDDTHLPR